MKIEMGESLMLSWLKHAKGCKIVQTNWKPSIHWNTYNDEEIKKLFNSANEYFTSSFSTKLFKNNSSEQTLLQAEIDVLGIDTDENSLYAVEIAFHEGGLIYGSGDETSRRITCKMIRSALILYSHFNIKKGEIFFASPKILPAQLEPLINCFEKINFFMQSQGFEYNFKLIGNEDFEEKILNPLIMLSSQVSDTSELFMRAFQLYKIFADGTKIKRSSNAQKDVYKDISTHSDYSEFKVGELVKLKLNYLFDNNFLSEDEIIKLQNSKYCKDTFGINFPLLLKIDKSLSDPSSQRLDPQGYSRYWKEAYGNDFFACSQWYAKSKPLFEKWLKEIESISTN